MRNRIAVVRINMVFTLLLIGIAMNLSGQTPLNSITIANSSGKDALVKIVGPTSHTLEVPDQENRTVNVRSGEYYLLIRFGTDSGNYTFAKGDAFNVEQTATESSAVTITLQSIVGGNYSTHPITAAQFGSQSADTPVVSEVGKTSESGLKEFMVTLHGLIEKEKQLKASVFGITCDVNNNVLGYCGLDGTWGPLTALPNSEMLIYVEAQGNGKMQWLINDNPVWDYDEEAPGIKLNKEVGELEHYIKSPVIDLSKYIQPGNTFNITVKSEYGRFQPGYAINNFYVFER